MHTSRGVSDARPPAPRTGLRPAALLALVGLGAMALAQGPRMQAGAPAAQQAIDSADPAAPLRIDQRVFDVPGSGLKVSTWREADGAGGQREMWSVATDGVNFTPARQLDGRLALRRDTTDPLVREPSAPASLKAANGSEIVIVQFSTVVLEAYVRDIEALGGTIYRFLPHNAYIARVPAGARRDLASRPWVRWIGPYDTAHRLDDGALQRVLAGAPVRVGQGPEADADAPPAHRYNIQVFERGMDQKAAVAEAIRALGGRVDPLIDDGFLLTAALTPEQLAAIAGADEVSFIDEWGPIGYDRPDGPVGYDMDQVRFVTGANFLRDNLGMTGAGVRGAVGDDNIRTTHVDFQANPIIFHTPVSGLLNHGTFVTGVIFGSGAGNPLALGMMPAGQPIFGDSDIIVSNRYTRTQELVESPYFAVFQSNSWGNPQTSQYTTVSAQIDDILMQTPIVLNNSMSNLGNQQCRPEAWAKNIIASGAILHRDTLTLADDCWCGLSSIGPASDGRIKPDLSHFGDFIFCPDGDSDTDYGQGCCTSGSTAIISGIIGLFHQLWHSGAFGNTPGPTVFDSRPSAAFVKAMLINTADQWPFVGVSSDLGRFKQGWGRPSLTNIINYRKVLLVDQSMPLQALDTQSWPIVVAAGEPFLRATMSYRDPPATPAAGIHRINNLNLKLTSPGGTVYWGNQGLTSGVWSTSGGTPDGLNTVENIFIQNPAAGTWQLEVSAAEVNLDGRPESAAMDADFALVVTFGPDPNASASYDLSWHTIDDGGTSAAVGDDFEVGSTTGQPDAGSMAGGGFTLAGGFWPVFQGPACNGDANGDGLTNGADLSVLLATFGQAVTPGADADFNGDGLVNGADLSVLLSNFGCPNT